MKIEDEGAPRPGIRARSNWRKLYAQGLIDASATEPLDRAFLERFDERLSAFGAPIADAWAPGAGEEHMDTLLAPLGIDLPDEARTWWGWHNGVRRDVPAPDRDLGGREPLSVDYAAELYEQDAGAQRQLFGFDGLLSGFLDKPRILFGCAGPRDQPVPIYVQGDIETPTIMLPSIRALLLAWIEFFELGVWRLNAEGRWAATHQEKIPAHLDLGIF